MKVAIHQPHFFPWLGYFDKMAKVNKFILLDEVQFEKGSQMIRNRVISNDGTIKYISISADTKGFLERKYRDIEVKNLDQWRTKHISALSNYYRKADYVDEIMSLLVDFYQQNFRTLNEWTCDSIRLVREILGVSTPMVFQSEIDYNRNSKKSELVLSLCEAVGADFYISGKGGSIGYLNAEEFLKHGVGIEYQSFEHPVYHQCNSPSFISGVSVLDLLFNCGIEKSKSIFWDNVDNSLCEGKG